MTLHQIFKRFLKDNDLYGYVFCSPKEDTFVSGRSKTMSRDINRFMSYSYNLLYLFYDIFSYDKLFRGMSFTDRRKHFYSLSRKWKYLLKHKVVLQTNISPGDIVTIKNCSGTRKVREIKATNSCYLVNFEGGYGVSIFRIESIKDKELFINLYIKDGKKECYGKVEGCYNEIQLQ